METLSSLKEYIEELINQINAELNWEEIKSHLLSYDRHMFNQLCTTTVDDENFQVVGKSGKALEDDYFWKLWCKGERFPSEKFPQFSDRLSTPKSDVWEFTQLKRQELLDTWHLEIHEGSRQELARYVKKYEGISVIFRSAVFYI